MLNILSSIIWFIPHLIILFFIIRSKSKLQSDTANFLITGIILLLVSSFASRLIISTFSSGGYSSEYYQYITLIQFLRVPGVSLMVLGAIFLVKDLVNVPPRKVMRKGVFRTFLLMIITGGFYSLYWIQDRSRTIKKPLTGLVIALNLLFPLVSYGRIYLEWNRTNILLILLAIGSFIFIVLFQVAIFRFRQHLVDIAGKRKLYFNDLFTFLFTILHLQLVMNRDLDMQLLDQFNQEGENNLTREDDLNLDSDILDAGFSS